MGAGTASYGATTGVPTPTLRTIVMHVYGRSIGSLVGLAALAATSVVVSALRVCVNIGR